MLEIVSEGPVHRFAAVDNVLVCFYRGAPPASALRDRLPWIERFVGSARGVGMLVVVDAAADGALPDEEFRRTSKEQAVKYADILRFSGTVIEGHSLKASLVRSFLRGLALVAARGIKVKFFEDVRTATEWVAALADGPSVDALTASVERLRHEIYVDR